MGGNSPLQSRESSYSNRTRLFTMTPIMTSYPLKGYLILPPSPVKGYRGVDRNPFVPLVLNDGELLHKDHGEDNAPRIYEFYLPGWRQDAYRIYEDNTIEDLAEEIELLKNREAARRIVKIIEPHLGEHEIVLCEIWGLESLGEVDPSKRSGFLGYDVAYPGGDFYSAILNGLLINPHPELASQYAHVLNENRLFPRPDNIPEFIGRFRSLVPSEGDSDFVVYKLSLAD